MVIRAEDITNQKDKVNQINKSLNFYVNSCPMTEMKMLQSGTSLTKMVPHTKNTQSIPVASAAVLHNSASLALSEHAGTQPQGRTS